MTTTITAVFDSGSEALRAQASLAEHGIGLGRAHLVQGAPRLPSNDPDSATYNEVLRRGGTVLLAQVDAAQVEMAVESLVLDGGKRDVARGSVRVPVREVTPEVPITLREEHAVVERHPVDRPATAAAGHLFQPRVLEDFDKVGQPVVTKPVFVLDDVPVHEASAERVETVRDSVRRTAVEVDGELAAIQAGAKTLA